MMINPRQKNFTRRSPSIPRELLRRGAVHLLPLYSLLRLSDLAREGIERSGSYAFADHIYLGVPSGRTVLGRWIDALLLRMPAARAFQRRCEYARLTVRRVLELHRRSAEPVRALAVPCGIPRDVIGLADLTGSGRPSLLDRIEYHGLDIDPDVLARARTMMATCGCRVVAFHCGDALDPAAYPDTTFHVIVSTGLGEFLDDDELLAFYRLVFERLEPGGVFYTSASARDRGSDFLLRLAELSTRYRTPEQLGGILRQLPWRGLDMVVDTTGLQTYVTATR
jgi:SAM-dependent methyltransferase